MFEGWGIRSVRSHLATHHMTWGKITPLPSPPGLYFSAMHEEQDQNSLIPRVHVSSDIPGIEGFSMFKVTR